MDSDVPSFDKLLEIDKFGRDRDPTIAGILVDNLESKIPDNLRKELFGFANSRVFLSKIDASSSEKRIIWELAKIAELEYISSIEKKEYKPELENTLSQLMFEVSLGLNLSDEGFGFKGFSDSFNFHEFMRNTEDGGTGKPPSWYSPKRWFR